MPEVGTFVMLYIVEAGGRYHVMPEYWDEIDAAYHHWIERRIDRVLSLTSNDGSALLIAASRIGEACQSTAESRRRDAELTAGLQAEAGYRE